MLSGEMARSQIADRVRQAELDRSARSTRAARDAHVRSGARRIVRTAAAMAIWPFKR